MKMNRLNTGLILSVFALISMLLFSACGSETSMDAGYTENELLVTDDTAKSEAVGTGGESIEIQQNAKIIRNVSIDGETKDFDAANDAVKKQISENGGYVESSNIKGGESLSNNYRSARTAKYVIRIPADKLDVFLQNTEVLLNITASTETTTDVTLDYYDIQSRLETLESKKTALEAMLEKAMTLDEILMIQDNLYNVIADIEAYQSKLNLYDNKVNYSTVDLEIIEVVEYTVIDDDEPSFGERISEAFTESWENFGEFCQDFVVFIVSALPVLMFPAIGGIIILTVWIIRRNKAKKNQISNKDKK